MSAAALARAKVAPLDRQAAINFLNTLPYLVASCRQKLLPEMQVGRMNRRKILPADAIFMLAFPVTIGDRTYVFPEQPFRVIRQITKAEYLAVLPNGYIDSYFYEISTD